MLSFVSDSQTIDFDQFYSSDFQPKELNSSVSARIEEEYNYYKQEYYNESDSINQRDFVYQHKYFLENLNRGGHVFYEDFISGYLNDLKDFIIEDVQLQNKVRVYLTDFPYFNAFTNDFGSIYIHIGALAHISSEEELLYLLAHEIGHVKLRHSYNATLHQNKRVREWNDREESERLDMHEFSRKQELEADLEAFNLLSKRIDARTLIQLFNKLRYSENPTIPGKTNFRLLSMNTSYSSFLDSTWNNLDSNLVDEVLQKIYKEKSNELKDHESMHPSVSVRIKKISELLEDYKIPQEHIPIGDFSEVKRMSLHLLVNSYLEERLFVNALDLIIKLREQDGENSFLVESQIKCLTAMLKQKHNTTEWNKQVLNIWGNSCNDTNYYKLRHMLLNMSTMDFNILCIESIESLEKLLPSPYNQEKLSDIAWLNLYDHFPVIFKQTDSLEWQFKSDSDGTLLFSDTKIDSKRELEEFNYRWNKTYTRAISPHDDLVYSDRSNRFVLMDHFMEHKNISEDVSSLINRFNMSNDQPASLLESTIGEVLIHPDRAVKLFKHGEVFKVNKFNSIGSTTLIGSDVYYFNSTDRNFFKLDLVNSAYYEEKLEYVFDKNQAYTYDISNKHGSENTVQNGHYQRMINIWLEDQNGDYKVNYSIGDEKVKEYVKETNTSYFVFNVLIINENLGKGRNYNLNFYEFYFDSRSGQIVYASKIGSPKKPSLKALERLVRKFY